MFDFFGRHGRERVPLLLTLRSRLAGGSPYDWDQVRGLLGSLNVAQRQVSGERADLMPVVVLAELSRAMLGAVVASPHVLRVTYNYRVRATLNGSRPAIHGDQVENVLKLQGTGVTVAVVDTGIDGSHPALRDSVVAAYDLGQERNYTWDKPGHGTHVSGIIASRDVFYRGMAPGARLVQVKVLGDDGGGTLADILQGLNWVAENAVRFNIRVANMSLGGSVWWCDGAENRDPSCEAVAALTAYGIVPVVAAGNSGPGANTLDCPGKALEAITVGATPKDLSKTTRYSSRGGAGYGPLGGAVPNKPDVVAPGGDLPVESLGIYSAQTGSGGWVAEAGTSMATPHVAGIVALYLQAARRAASNTARLSAGDVATVKRRLMMSVARRGTAGVSGAGLVDARRMIGR